MILPSSRKKMGRAALYVAVDRISIYKRKTAELCGPLQLCSRLPYRQEQNGACGRPGRVGDPAHLGGQLQLVYFLSMITSP
jgi:hypothetical protein